jgi:heme-degrading monooxygenase HmoA
MVARVTEYRIRPGKLKEFTATCEALTASIDKLHGFRVLVILRGPDKDSQEAMAISLWDSAEDLHASDNDEFYYHAVAKVMSFCESFSPMHEHQVLLSKFAPK